MSGLEEEIGEPKYIPKNANARKETIHGLTGRRVSITLDTIHRGPINGILSYDIEKNPRECFLDGRKIYLNNIWRISVLD
ncbi:MAG: hypothetical protein Q7S06_02910 [Nanoarchaeota archaeon]|nr:hypothetical protein [Nanoarchaeota archaeon]